MDKQREQQVVRHVKVPVHLEFGSEARESLVRGAMKLARAVGCTLGPGGRCVHIDRGIDTISTRDGVTVAHAAKELQDPRERMGAMLLAEAAQKVADQCGDGTTTTVVLAERLLRESFRLLASGAEPNLLVKEIRQAAAAARSALMDSSIAMRDVDIEAVASAACKGDARVIGPVAAAYRHVGTRGTVVLRNGDSGKTELLLEEGFRIERGWTTAGYSLLTDRLVLEKVFVCATPRSLMDPSQVLRIMEFAAVAKGSLLIVCHQIGGKAQAALLENNSKGALRCCAVIAPSFHDLQRSFLEDLATWTGGRVLDDYGELPTEGLGYTDKAIVTKDRTVLLCAENAMQPQIDQRIKYLHNALPNLNDYDADKVKQRIGRLQGRVAEIHAGAPTDSERTELKHRIEDALGAVRVSLQDGMVHGAGAALVRAGCSLPGETLGERALIRALSEPCRRLHENAGQDGSLAVERAKELGVPPCWDPARVVCAALAAAVSTVTTLILSEASLVYRHDLRS
jgi:chaperonin GroEL